MFERFTDRARKVMALANQEGQLLNHAYMGTEHLLLGLVKEGSGVAAMVLKNLGVDLGKVREEVKKLVRVGAETVPLGKLPMTPRAKKVIEYAIIEARSMGHDYVGTEHLLLGLLREKDGVASQALLNLGLNLESLRAEVLALLGQGPNSLIAGGQASQPYAGRPMERFSDRARKAMALANQEAQLFNHEFIGPEHILLGLVKEGSGGGAAALKAMGVDLGNVRLEVEKLVKSAPEMVTKGKLEMMASAKQVIEHAIEEMRKLEHKTVEAEHLLLALMRNTDTVAARVLINMGVNLEELRQTVLGLLRQEQAVKPPATSPFERFTDRARKVMAMANQEAQRFNHEYIGTEHLLLGLLREDAGMGVKVLKKLDVNLSKVRLEVEKAVKSGPNTVTMGKLPQTPRMKTVLIFAIEEAHALGYKHVSTEHLLLGLLRETHGTAGRILGGLGVRVEDVRVEVVNMMRAGEGEGDS